MLCKVALSTLAYISPDSPMIDLYQTYNIISLVQLLPLHIFSPNFRNSLDWYLTNETNLLLQLSENCSIADKFSSSFARTSQEWCESAKETICGPAIFSVVTKRMDQR